MSPWRPVGEAIVSAGPGSYRRGRGSEGLQFWPSTFEIPAMLPAPKAWVGLAKRTSRIMPHRRGVIFKVGMMLILWALAARQQQVGLL